MDKYLVKQQQKRKSPDQSCSPDKRSKIEEKSEKMRSDEKERKVSAKKLEVGKSDKKKESEEKTVKKQEKNRESIDVWLGKSTKAEPGTSKDLKKKEEKPAKKEKVSKDPKNEEKPPEKEKEVPKPPTPEPQESEERKNRNQLMAASELPEGVNRLGTLLPTMRGKTISDEDMDKLVRALCGDTGKTFDSDDSILSDIDRMNDEEIAEKDAKFRRTIEYIDELPNKMQALNAVLNQGNETKEERDERRRVLRELQSGLKTKEEKEAAERKRARKVARMQKRLKTNVQVFDIDKEKKTQLKLTTPFMSCSQFAGLLEILAEIVPDDRKASEEEGDVDFREQIKMIDETALERKLKYGAIRGNFYTRDRTLSDYLKKKIRKILADPDILDVLDGHRYGFEFSTRDVLLVLETYYSMNKPKKDNGSSIRPLQINISKLISSAFHVARADNPNFVLNEALKMAMFE